MHLDNIQNFSVFKKTPKTYKATLWLGVYSLSLDDQNIKEIKNIKEFDLPNLQQIIDQMQGIISYTPPQFSAKRINGTRAYELAKKV